ncbi:MAG TPA: hypothetical protein PK857_00405 [Hyphomicrobium sp.]|nr:hypothetical protein [Hyphomicrobium sp.]HRO48799.1 hypothetical protein [Hyphomicrobium sp.]
MMEWLAGSDCPSRLTVGIYIACNIALIALLLIALRVLHDLRAKLEKREGNSG